MSKSPEIKVAEQLVNLTETHWFNPGIMGHILAEQPHYTIDRIVELLANVIRHQAKRYRLDWEHGQTSEGLHLANELNNAYNLIRDSYTWNNLDLPKDVPLPKAGVETKEYTFGYIDNNTSFR